MQRARFAPLLGCALAAHAAEIPVPPGPGTPRQVTIDDVDARLKSFRSTLWNLPGNMGFPPPDHTGATVESDLARYVLRDENLARLNQSQAAARNALPPDSNVVPESALAPLAKIMSTETCRLMMVSGYWQARLAGAYHEDMIENLLQHLPTRDNTSTRARMGNLARKIDALRSDLDTSVNACDSGIPPRAEDRGNPLADYNALRLEVLAVVLKATPAGEPAWIKRNKPCPAPATLGTTDSPRRLIASRSIADIYPRDAITYQIEGQLKVRIHYDIDGCVQDAAIAQSSGADILDQAGIAYAFSMQFQPAVVGGKPVEEIVIAPLSFYMRDYPTENLPNQPQP